MELYTSAEQEAAMAQIEGNGNLILEVDEAILLQEEEISRLQEEYDEICSLLQNQKKK